MAIIDHEPAQGGSPIHQSLCLERAMCEVMRPSRAHPVAQLLSHCSQAASRGPGCGRTKVALVVEGGGMRGVTSGGMLVALHDLGLSDAFDVVYGCSSGAINASYFLGSELPELKALYLRRWKPWEVLGLLSLSEGSRLDVSAVFSLILEGLNSAAFGRIAARREDLQVAITDIDRPTAMLASNFSAAEDLIQALVASCWLPITGMGFTTFQGRRALDGCILAAHPIMHALQSDCTHILSLSTRPHGTVSRDVGIGHQLLARRLDLLRRGLGRSYLRAARDYRAVRAGMDGRDASSPRVTPLVLDIAPPLDTRPVAWLSSSVTDRAAAFDAGARAVEDALKHNCGFGGR